MTGSGASTSEPTATIDIAEAVLAQNALFLKQILDSETNPRRLVAVIEGLATLHTSLKRQTIVNLINATKDSSVKRSLATHFSASHPDLHEELLRDEDPSVVEAAAYSAGESGQSCYRTTLEKIAVEHSDLLCRESAIASLGSIGDPRSLQVVLRALDDRPTIRRRAVVALSAFDDPQVELALERAKNDKDFQVRTLAEDLLRPQI
jgi:HEAT repeat protein